jgi:gluconokinase
MLISFAAMIVVVFGPSGAGKTTVGRALAQRVGCRFLEGDGYHSPENVALMRSGKPLSDAEREPWLAALAREIASSIADGRCAVLACSALKRSYRRKLVPRDASPGDVAFVYLKAPADTLARRLKTREEHFFPPQLLRTQLEVLEEPNGAEPAPVVSIDAAQPVESVVDEICRELKLNEVSAASSPAVADSSQPRDRSQRPRAAG